MRIVDISNALEAGIASDPPSMLPEIQYIAHKDSVEMLAASFPGLTAADLPGGEGWAVERIAVSTHNGTHLDAPYHHHSTMNGGERAITIDEVPLEWCFAPGVKLDLRHYDDGHVLTRAEMKAALEATGHTLKPLDIVLVNTAAGAKYGEPNYVASGCGVGRDATEYLLEQGVRVTGTDAWSWDAPFVHTAKRWAETRDPSIIWEGHRASMTTGYCHMEKLANLDTLPPNGFKVSCFPFKIKGASAGFTRAVAIFED